MSGCAEEITVLKTLALLFVFVCSLYANHINWMGDYSQALILAKKENKPLMVLLVKSDCPSCNETIAKVFTNRPYIHTLNQKVISVLVTKDSKVAYPIELLYSTHFPTLFLINSENEIFMCEPFYGVITQDDINYIKNILIF